MLQELLSTEIAPIGSTHYDACRPSPMSTSTVSAISVARHSVIKTAGKWVST